MLLEVQAVHREGKVTHAFQAAIHLKNQVFCQPFKEGKIYVNPYFKQLYGLSMVIILLGIIPNSWHQLPFDEDLVFSLSVQTSCSVVWIFPNFPNRNAEDLSSLGKLKAPFLWGWKCQASHWR